MLDDDKPNVSEKDVAGYESGDAPDSAAGSHSKLKSRHLYMIATGGRRELFKLKQK